MSTCPAARGRRRDVAPDALRTRVAWSWPLHALLGLLGSACSADFPAASHVEQPRLLGARLSVVGDSGRSSPHPGERLRAHLTLVDPERDSAPERVSIMSIQCRYPERFTGNPICQELLDQATQAPERFAIAFRALGTVDDPRVICGEDQTIWAQGYDRETGSLVRSVVGASFLSALGVTLRCGDGTPTLPVNVAKERSAADALLVRGVVCTEGTAMLSTQAPLLFGCQEAGDTNAIPFHTRIDIVDPGGAEDNRNPVAADVEVWVNGTPWPASTESATCQPQTTDAGPLLDPDMHRITVGVQPDALEVKPDGTREQLVVELFADDGSASASRLLLGARRAGAGGQVTFTWNAPTDLAATEERPVRFWITVRDQRGGFLAIERHACVRWPA